MFPLPGLCTTQLALSLCLVTAVRYIAIVWLAINVSDFEPHVTQHSLLGLCRCVISEMLPLTFVSFYTSSSDSVGFNLVNAHFQGLVSVDL